MQVKVQESGREYIFPASGFSQRDDDSDNVYVGVVYIFQRGPSKDICARPREYIGQRTCYLVYSYGIEAFDPCFLKDTV